MKKNILLCALIFFSTSIFAKDVIQNNKTTFTLGDKSYFFSCMNNDPNHLSLTDDKKIVNLQWSQSNWNHKRVTKGIEICNMTNFFSKGYVSFDVFIPSSNYPYDKEGAIFQLFQKAYCNSWVSLLVIKNNNLYIRYRNNCGKDQKQIIYNNLPRNTWINISLNFKLSKEKNGYYEIWVNGNKVFSKTNINIGFGEWSDDKLIQPIHAKFGQYNYDTKNYSLNEIRSISFKNIVTNSDHD